jgi:transcriptional/translational regulatory protein YebC/TACO1
MADPGSVPYFFNRKGVVVPKGELSEDDVLGAVLDAGAEEVNDLGESFEVISEATDLVAVRTAFQDTGIDYDSADANFVPTMQDPWGGTGTGAGAAVPAFLSRSLRAGPAHGLGMRPRVV